MRLKLSVEKIHNFLKKYNKWILLAVFVLILGLNFYFYYRYVYLVTKAQLEVEFKEAAVDEQTLGKILDNLDIREGNLLRVNSAIYNDPFR